MTDDTPGSEVAVLVALARLEGKLDTALAQHGARLDEHATAVTDHELRLRTLEATSTVSPRQLWITLASAVAVFVSLSPLLSTWADSLTR